MVISSKRWRPRFYAIGSLLLVGALGAAVFTRGSQPRDQPPATVSRAAAHAAIDRAETGEASKPAMTAPPSPAPDIARSEVGFLAERSAQALEEGRLVDALAPLRFRSEHGRCEWALWTNHREPGDLDLARVRMRVKRHASRIGVDLLAFARYRDTRVFVTVECP